MHLCIFNLKFVGSIRGREYSWDFMRRKTYPYEEVKFSFFYHVVKVRTKSNFVNFFLVNMKKLFIWWYVYNAPNHTNENTYYTSEFYPCACEWAKVLNKIVAATEDEEKMLTWSKSIFQIFSTWPFHEKVRAKYFGKGY